MITVETQQTTETRVGQMAGRFELITGQLKNLQLYLHAKFSDMDARFERREVRPDRMEQQLITMDQKIDALPRVLAEMLARK